MKYNKYIDNDIMLVEKYNDLHFGTYFVIEYYVITPTWHHVLYMSRSMVHYPSYSREKSMTYYDKEFI